MPANNVSPSLQGCRVALTISADEPHSPADTLREREAALFFYPGAQILPPDTFDALDHALIRAKAGEISWLLFTTPCAVEAVAERLAQLGLSPNNFTATQVAFFGAQTQVVAAAHFPTWQSTLPQATSHAQLIEAMRLSADTSVLIPIAQRTRADWSTLVAARGAQAIDAPAYRLILGRGGDDLPGLLWGGLIDAVVFLTENSVRHFVIRLKAEGGSLDMLNDVIIACLDDQTATAARDYGLYAQVVPAKNSYPDLAENLARYFSAEAVTA